MLGGLGFFQMADSPFAPIDIGFVSTAKATHDNKVAERHQRRLYQLQREAKVAMEKAQASKQALEGEARKRARSSRTMRSYFTSSRNSLYHKPLQCSDVGAVCARSSNVHLIDTVGDLSVRGH